MKKLIVALVATVMALGSYAAANWGVEGSETTYDTLTLAVSAAPSGGRVILLQDVTFTTFTELKTQSVTIDLNGKTITNTGTSWTIKLVDGYEIELTKADGVATITCKLAVQPVVPGGEIDVPQGKSTEDFCLNEAGTNAVVTAEKAADAAALTAVLGTSADTVEMSTGATIPGFYYSVKQNASVTALDTRQPGDKNNLSAAGEAKSFTLDKSGTAGFYQTLVTPAPLK